MHIFIYFGVVVSIFLLMEALERAGRVLERYWRIKDTQADNAALLERQRAMDKKMRRLESRLSTQDYQRSSALEYKLQQAMEENASLRRELKVKESLLRSVNRKNSTPCKDGAQSCESGENL